MDEIEQRLTDTVANCIKAYQAWRHKTADLAVRESLQEAIHELRKVSSRLEIEIALSERDQMASRPIPIPPHRASRKPRGDQHMHEGNGNRAAPSSSPSLENSAPTETDLAQQAAIKKIVRRKRPQKAEGGEE